jgi:hypothetical protein
MTGHPQLIGTYSALAPPALDPDLMAGRMMKIWKPIIETSMGRVAKNISK